MTTKDMMKSLVRFTGKTMHLVLISAAMLVVWALKRMCYLLTMRLLMRYDRLSHKAEQIVGDQKWELLWKL